MAKVSVYFGPVCYIFCFIARRHCSSRRPVISWNTNEPVHWHKSTSTGILRITGYPYKTHLKLKSFEMSFVNNIRFSGPIVSKFWIEHGIADILKILQSCTKPSIGLWVSMECVFIYSPPSPISIHQISYLTLDNASDMHVKSTRNGWRLFSTYLTHSHYVEWPC